MPRVVFTTLSSSSSLRLQGAYRYNHNNSTKITAEFQRFRSCSTPTNPSSSSFSSNKQRKKRSEYSSSSSFLNLSHLRQLPFLSFQHKHHLLHSPRRCRSYHSSYPNMVQGIVIDDENCIVNVNPATAMVISRVPCTPIDDIPILVQQAREAFLSWSQQASLEERIECLRQGLNTLATREEELISLIIQEMGKPVAEAKEEVTMALSKRGDYLDLVQASLQPQRQPPPHSNTVVVRQALGVVVIISPWNFPVDEILLLALPALASGNVVIVKPSEVTPETGATVVACLSQALPPGVLQLVQGDGTVGAALVSHPDVNLIAMTGSSATGRHIYQTAAVTSTTPPPAMAMAETTTTTVSTTTTPADVTIMDWAQGGTVYQSTSESTATAVMETTTTTTLTSSSSPARVTVPPPPPLKRVVLEMGGKDPMIVFADADLNVAARDAVAYSLANTGQVCCSIERIYVDESIYDDFCKRVTQVATTFSVGNGQDPHVKVGPLVSPIQRDHVDAQVQDALERGATLLYQSDIPENHTNTDVTCTATLTLTTCFYPVTVLGDVTHEMDVFSRETFGPVVALSKFDGSEEQAIQLANQTEYGLASSVYTTDLAKAQRVASAIDAGQVGINCYAIEHMNIHCPWVGHKNSGFGFHSGVDGFHQFSIPKTIVFPPDDQEALT